LPALRQRGNGAGSTKAFIQELSSDVGIPITELIQVIQGGGKGRGIKADDNLVAALCLKCHWEIDQGVKLTKRERQEMWQKAHQRTMSALQ
jgi:hypothetical protein